jgi:lysophospholipase L1-like esterase
VEDLMSYKSPLNERVLAYNLRATQYRKFRTAMAKAQTGGTNAHIVCYGDSITAGYNATNKITGGWVGRLRTLIDTAVGSTRGTGFLWALSFQLSGTGGYDSRVVLSGSIGVTWGGFGSGIGPVSGPGGAGGGGLLYPLSGQTITFGPVVADRFTMYFRDNISGGFTTTIDGSASTTIAFGTSNTMKSQSIDVAQGSHTLVGTATASSLGVLGVEARQNGATGGVRVSTIGYSGMKVAAFVDTALNYDGPLRTEFDALAPDLSIIMLQTNDSNVANNTALATYKSGLQSMITRAKLTGDVLLVSTTPQSILPTPIKLPEYTKVLYELCDANGIGLVDVAGRFGPSGTSPAFMDDSYHPNDAGHQDIASAVFEAIRTLGVGL